jgi:glycosyltransferase involved in cell wall biosynthesis
MKIAITHDHLFQFGGAERTLVALTQAFPQADVYTLVQDPAIRNLGGLKAKTTFLQRLPGSLRHFKWYLPLMPLAWESLDMSAYDVVISSASAFAKGIVPGSNATHICYCHTPTRYLWSDTHSYVDELPTSRVVKLVLPFILKSLREWDYLAAQRVDQFLANSKFVGQRISRYYGRDSQVVYPPVDVTSIHPATRTPESGAYYVVVSRLRPYKRVDAVVRAFNQLGLPLVIVGDGEQRHELQVLAKHNIRFMGEVDDAERNRILAGAAAFIHPQVEDFGITAVEAMAAGRPVLALNQGGALETVAPEISGDFFDEQSWEALAHAVLKFRPNDYDPIAIRQHAEQFSTERFIREMMEYVAKVVKEK